MKDIGCGCFTVVVFTVLLLLAIPIYDIYQYKTEPKHKVLIEYTVYSPAGPINKSEIYECSGKEFETSLERAGSKTSTLQLMIKKKHIFANYIGSQAVCVYLGNSDVVVHKCKIIK